MSFTFSCPSGAPVDVKELEYIAALQMTCIPTTRDNGTVGSLDILRFLRSRFEIDITHKQALRIIRGFGGGSVSEEVVERMVTEAMEQKEEPKNNPFVGTMEWAKQSEMNRQIQLALSKLNLTKTDGAPAAGEANDQDDAPEEAKAEEEQQTNENQEDEELLADDPEEYLDLVQLTSVLLIPSILKMVAHHEANPDTNDAGAGAGADGNDESLTPGPSDGPRRSDSGLNPKHLLRKMDEKEDNFQKELKERLQPPSHILRQIYNILLMSIQCEPSEPPPKLTKELLKMMLENHGEGERAQDDALLLEMMEQCGGEGVVFDFAAFQRALTQDLKLYETGCEDDMTTTIYDVWGYDTTKGHLEHTSEQESKDMDDEDHFLLKELPSNAKPDFAIDTHGSLLLIVLIWVFYIGTSLIYIALFQTLPLLQTTCDVSTFRCRLLDTIRVWLIIAILLIIFGFLTITPLTMGTNYLQRPPHQNVLFLLLTLVYTVVPFVILETYELGTEEPYDDTEAMVSTEIWEVSTWCVQGVGYLLIIATIRGVIGSFIGSKWIHTSTFLTKYLSTSNQFGQFHAKTAATQKINALLLNAYEMHPHGNRSSSVATNRSSYTDATMVNYLLHGEKRVSVGGVIWTFKQLYSRKLFSEQGIWIPTRVSIIQITQVGMAGIVTYMFALFIEYYAESADDVTDSLPADLPSWIYSFVPNGRHVRSSLYPALAISFLVMAFLTLLYLPSYVTTTLKFRTGVYPALKSAQFTLLRNNVDLVYSNIGNAIYALVGSAGVFFVLIGVCIFLCVWPFTKDFMLLLIAWGLGITVTVVLKMLLSQGFRARYYRAFYRTNPARANLTTLALECWFLGLGGGVLLGRLCQFLFAAAFWVGRIDVPFLSDDVNLFGYIFDYVPANFVKGLLQSEAHRHPYLERIMTMYMLKLKDNSFAKEAGSCWRQLLVVTLMPWLMKYRVFSEERALGSLELYTRQIQLKQLKNPTFVAVNHMVVGDISNSVPNQSEGEGDQV